MANDTESDKQEYLRSILGKRVFRKVYSICGDGDFALQTLSTESRAALTDFIAWTQTQPDIPADTADRASLTFRTERVSDVLRLSNTDRVEYLNKAYNELSDEVYRARLACLNEFIDVVNDLRAHVLDADFWKGAGQG